MSGFTRSRASIGAVLVAFAGACTAQTASAPHPRTLEIIGHSTLFAPGIASTEFSDVHLTISPDGRTALWFSRNRPGGPGGYDIWMSKRASGSQTWGTATPVSFNTKQRDFDPAFSSDGRYIYFCSDRPGGFGGDDIYRVPVVADGFGEPERLGGAVNSAGNEWAPMLSPDQTLLLFSSNGRGGSGRFDLFTARVLPDGSFGASVPVPGTLNTHADEFDATFLADGTTIIFSRAPDLQVDRVSLYHASLRNGGYDAGIPLPQQVNPPVEDVYSPMLDWSRRDRITFSGQRPEAQVGSTDLYVVRYRLR